MNSGSIVTILPAPGKSSNPRQFRKRLPSACDMLKLKHGGFTVVGNNNGVSPEASMCRVPDSWNGKPRERCRAADPRHHEGRRGWLMAIAPKFSEFLQQKLHLSPQECPRPSEWSGTGNTIGALALRLGCLSLNQIDNILQRQQGDKRLFGELGVELGYLKSADVDRLILLQKLHLDLEAGELLVLAGKTDIPTLLTHLLEFRRETSAK